MFGILAFGMLPCSLDDDKAGIFDWCLLKKSGEGLVKEVVG
jgi:hypothetical protein